MAAAAQFRDVLARLSVREALALARAVELRRLERREMMPTELVLDALRPTLQTARAPRVIDLRRLVARAFEPFLTDRADQPRVPGLLPRAAIMPWWEALPCVAAGEIAAFENRLAALIYRGDEQAIDALAREAQGAAGRWTNALIAALGDPAGGALRHAAPGPMFVDDVMAMAVFLSLAQPLADAWSDIDRVLGAARRLAGPRIIDFTPGAVTLAKRHYRALNETHGVESRYLALALMNRLERPWQVLRLARALSWKPNDALLRNTEFGVVGERLVRELTRSIDAITALVVQPGELPDLTKLGVAVAAAMDELEGWVAEFTFRRDGWGEAILEMRATLGQALSRGWFDRIAAEAVLDPILPQRRRGLSRLSPLEPELRVPAAGAADAAVAAARFLALLADRGGRHGLGQAREAADALAGEIARRAAVRIELLRPTSGDAVIEAQIEAAARVLDIIGPTGSGETLLRLASEATA
jgi:hypothetical protein